MNKKVTKKKVRKKSEPINDGKFLSETEVLKLELLDKERIIVASQKTIMTLNKKILDLEFEKEHLKKHNEYVSTLDKKSNLVKELTDKYKLKSDLKSFDPITGEIKDE